MTQQKSEDRVVPDGQGNLVGSRAPRRGGGGKAVSVKEEERQLTLFPATADSSRRSRETRVRGGVDRSTSQRTRVPKAGAKPRTTVPVTMEEVIGRLSEAFEKVATNRGAPGPDRQTIEQVREQLPVVLTRLAIALSEGSYYPGDIRRVWIPKASGGQRGLGIPNVIDRMVQEAVRSVFEPLYEPTFHPSSHGFRPGRSCQTAIAEARAHVAEGHHVVVDLDLEKFFDQVCHQRLMSRLAQRVVDKRLLVLVGRMLEAKVVLPDGVRESTEQGVPQGGPLSPLLSNIVLSELDEELARRGLRFVRYADDCNIYVRSERAGQRVMASVTAFIERRLRLKVNAAKSAVARPETRHFLGYRLQPREGQMPEILLSERSEQRLHDRIRELTPRTRGWSLRAIIRAINAYFDGWIGHFGVCTSGIDRVLQTADAHLRRRLRAILLCQWKTKLTTARRLIRLGVKPATAWRRIYEGRKSLWALSHTPAVERGLRNAYFAKRGLVTLLERFQANWATIGAPTQLLLPLGPARS